MKKRMTDNVTMFLKKNLGQNFLKDRNILKLEVALANVIGKVVLEIGPGDGRLTEELLVAGAMKVIAVEKDSRFVMLLREKFAGRPVEILEGDFLEMPLSMLTSCSVAIGNIPYYISSEIIFRLAGFIHVERIVLMVQKEFARKMIAIPNAKNYGRLSVTSQLAFDVKIERTVGRHLFSPAPRVDSAIILLKPTGRLLTEHEGNVIRALFQHRNKTIRNALMDSKRFTAEEINEITRTELQKYLPQRVRIISPKETLEIAKYLK